MPELPEVEKARRALEREGKDKIIQEVQTTEDSIVYSGTTHDEFANEIRGRNITAVKRYGKLFYLELDGPGRMPVLHFGMTGLLQIQGQAPMQYQSSSRTPSTQWPPKFCKFILHLSPSTPSVAPLQIAFCDARRLGRIRLCAAPASSPPISSLGFDPLLSMPPLPAFAARVRARGCPIKALLLDQAFSAGVGNWVADEVLYHARVHPEQRCRTLRADQIAAIHTQLQAVCRTAVDADADSSKFPDDWLFLHRWGKGKKKKPTASVLKLPSGEPATIKWVTVGGRTSAYVEELQRLPTSDISAEDEPDDSDLTPLSDEDTVVTKPPPKRKRKTPRIPDPVQSEGQTSTEASGSSKRRRKG